MGCFVEARTVLLGTQRLKKTRGYVYFIGSKRGTRLSYVKIGWSVNPKKRLVELQRASPYQLVLLGSFPAEKEVETTLHRLFGHIRVRPRCEWFLWRPQFQGLVSLSREPVRRRATSKRRPPTDAAPRTREWIHRDDAARGISALPQVRRLRRAS